MPNTDNSLNISVTFRHTDSSDSLKKHAYDKLVHCLNKYIKKHADVHAVLSVEKRDHLAEIHVVSKGFEGKVSAATENLYTAIDKVVHKLDLQLRKQKEKHVELKHASVPV